jgi:hypothetical protein
MSAIRRAATRILTFAVSHSAGRNRSWGAAMLREMDFVDNDWTALRWALGSTTAICGQSLIQRLSDCRDSDTRSSQGIKRSMVSVLCGIAAAAAILAASVTALATLTHGAGFEPSQRRLFGQLFVVAIPFAIYLLGALALRRARWRVSSGIFAAGSTLIAHTVIYIATYK